MEWRQESGKGDREWAREGRDEGVRREGEDR